MEYYCQIMLNNIYLPHPLRVDEEGTLGLCDEWKTTLTIPIESVRFQKCQNESVLNYFLPIFAKFPDSLSGFFANPHPILVKAIMEYLSNVSNVSERVWKNLVQNPDDDIVSYLLHCNRSIPVNLSAHNSNPRMIEHTISEFMTKKMGDMRAIFALSKHADENAMRFTQYRKIHPHPVSIERWLRNIEMSQQYRENRENRERFSRNHDHTFFDCCRSNIREILEACLDHHEFFTDNEWMAVMINDSDTAMRWFFQYPDFERVLKLPVLACNSHPLPVEYVMRAMDNIDANDAKKTNIVKYMAMNRHPDAVQYMLKWLRVNRESHLRLLASWDPSPELLAAILTESELRKVFLDSCADQGKMWQILAQLMTIPDLNIVFQ